MVKHRERGLVFYRDIDTGNIYCYGNGGYPFNIGGLSKDIIFDKAYTYTKVYFINTIRPKCGKNITYWIPDHKFVKKSLTLNFLYEDFNKRLAENLDTKENFIIFA